MINNHKWTEEEKTLLKERFSLEDTKKLALEFGVSVSAVNSLAFALGVSKTNKKRRAYKNRVWTEEKQAILKTKYFTEGPDLFLELGVTRKAVKTKAKKLGLKTRKRKFKYDWEFFENWTEDLAYTLGYTWADGCVHRLKNGILILVYYCKAADNEILHKIKEVMKVPSKVRTFYKKPIDPEGLKPLEKNQVRVLTGGWFSELRIKNGKLIESLQEIHKIPCRKSRIDNQFPENIPEALMPHFIRGYFDGDGTCGLYTRKNGYTEYNFELYGQQKFIEGLRDVLIRLGLTEQKTSIMKNGIWRIKWSSIGDMLKLKSILYPEGTRNFLTRKKQIMERISEDASSRTGKVRRMRFIP